jgi:hypothetical protein
MSLPETLGPVLLCPSLYNATCSFQYRLGTPPSTGPALRWCFLPTPLASNSQPALPVPNLPQLPQSMMPQGCSKVPSAVPGNFRSPTSTPPGSHQYCSHQQLSLAVLIASGGFGEIHPGNIVGFPICGLDTSSSPAHCRVFISIPYPCP